MVNGEPVQQASIKKKRRKSALILLAVLFLLIVADRLIYWFLVLRHHQETDDAYVAGNQTQVMAQVSGNVNTVWFDNTDFVKKGDVLVTLDKTGAEQAFEKAQTALATSFRQTHQLLINSRQYQANIKLQKNALTQAEADLKRQEPLGAPNLTGREDLQHARDAVATAKAQPEVAKQRT
ncbi:biotin/lipoyl-binding protein [Erwinia tracheiphila]|uniref:Biotin/lipoyl-binding protein n=1 Tax=Erwinia tracheiphila TaxID=65700 RepID=A0A345CNY2_9GAMM|nr:biotin/lipoyl-binding protein [Erwinia tracheiphila]